MFPEQFENMTLNKTLRKPVGNVMLKYWNSHRRKLFLNILWTIWETSQCQTSWRTFLEHYQHFYYIHFRKYAPFPESCGKVVCKITIRQLRLHLALRNIWFLEYINGIILERQTNLWLVSGWYNYPLLPHLSLYPPSFVPFIILLPLLRLTSEQCIQLWYSAPHNNLWPPSEL